jgi:hypothetical protein
MGFKSRAIERLDQDDKAEEEGRRFATRCWRTKNRGLQGWMGNGEEIA